MLYGVWWVFNTETFPPSSFTDISPPWWDFVMVGICRQAIIMIEIDRQKRMLRGFFKTILIMIIIFILVKVDVEEHELGGFLKTATGLQIKGLSDDQSGQVGNHRLGLTDH